MHNWGNCYWSPVCSQQIQTGKDFFQCKCGPFPIHLHLSALFFASWLSTAVCAWLRGWENLLLAGFPGALKLGVPEVFTVVDASDTSDLWRLFGIKLDFSLWMITPPSVNIWCNLSVCISLKLIYKYSSGTCFFFFLLLMSIPGVGNGQRGLAGCSSWGRKKLDPTEQLKTDEHTLSSFLY